MHLPIAKKREKIEQTILEHPVTLIVAETGSGKSTQVPRYLLDLGYKVIVTQPRRLAAFSVAQYVADEYGEPLGQTIGVRTRDEKISCPETRLLFATDGLVVMRELMGHTGYDVLIIDEVHEWNQHIEALVALARVAVTQGRPIKIVIMSATIDAEGLSRYFGDAPIIAVTGRAHVVKKLTKGNSVIDDAIHWLKKGKNTLVFFPGKREIQEFIQELKEHHRIDAEVLPLHAELTSSEQQKCFARYGRPKCIVATSVAQTSITIDDIDLVIDSGLENRAEIHGGISGLYEQVISLACSEQRRGRAGRTRPGWYIDHAPEMDRIEYPVPEILRIKLDQLALRLALVGQRLNEIEFFHQPTQETTRFAERVLQEFECLTDAYHVTRKGGRIALLPVSVEAGCMLVEAERRGVISEMIPIVSIFEAGGIVDTDGGPGSGEWRELCSSEKDSDLIAQAMVMSAIKRMPKVERSRYALKSKSLERAEAIQYHLRQVFVDVAEVTNIQASKDAVLHCLAEGLKRHRYKRTHGSRKYQAQGGEVRKLQRSSVVEGHRHIVGAPWDIRPEIGGRTLHLVTFATRID